MYSEDALKRHYARNQRWGFTWALWTAVLWGAWYIPGTALWYEYPYSAIGPDQQAHRLVATAVMTWLHAIAVFIFLALWNGSLGKLKDYGRTLVRFRKISKWYALASLFGGPMAIFGSYMAMGFVGPVFAAVTSLFYPVVGAVIARLWYHEKISAQAALGMAIIIMGGVVIYGPGLFGEDLMGGYAWLGYAGGIMSAIGWGAEGAVASRAMDVTDPDVGIQCRFTFEILFWGVLILPLLMLFTDLPVMHLLVETVASIDAMKWMLLASVCHAYCYTSFYKSFSLIGVGRGEAIGNLYGVFAVIFVAAVTLELPEWYFIVGLILTVTGSFVMFREPPESIAELRSVTETTG
ncbi:DMT family transporter [Methylophaga sp. OBS4]|uniref:DMT family transporter n=1 Tax=Methylophaga sp. OBS4 TaxID=2991935 RepID=UPI0022557B83|nr:DMT family transporter [Methylophaga sp. OBS4]MCX4187085.1 DMT family transporter [Methylophaga sp. OBS4]